MGRGVLMLVPEIALTPAVAAIFRWTFGDRVAIQHSGLSDGERHDQWHRIRRGDVDVVVGTRSAVFAPVRSLGLIIVDEEHDGSYKQEESPRYHGRDVAVVRGSQAGALVVLGSATPAHGNLSQRAERPLPVADAYASSARSANGGGADRRHARRIRDGGSRRDPERGSMRRGCGSSRHAASSRSSCSIVVDLRPVSSADSAQRRWNARIAACRSRSIKPRGAPVVITAITR